MNITPDHLQSFAIGSLIALMFSTMRRVHRLAHDLGVVLEQLSIDGENARNNQDVLSADIGVLSARLKTLERAKNEEAKS